MTTTTTTHTRHSNTMESVLALALLWFVPAVAFVMALFFVW